MNRSGLDHLFSIIEQHITNFNQFFVYLKPQYNFEIDIWKNSSAKNSLLIDGYTIEKISPKCNLN